MRRPSVLPELNPSRLPPLLALFSYPALPAANPLSAFEYDRQPPYAPLFPLYVPLSSLDPRTPPSVAAESAVPLPRDIFGLPLRRDVLHACVVHHANLLKRGTTHTKNRAEVRGSGKKLHRQKGTGRARVADSGSGTRASPALPLRLALFLDACLHRGSVAHVWLRPFPPVAFLLLASRSRQVVVEASGMAPGVGATSRPIFRARSVSSASRRLSARSCARAGSRSSARTALSLPAGRAQARRAGLLSSLMVRSRLLLF